MDWLVVTSPENFASTRRLDFTVQGFKSRHRKKVSTMVPGDVLAYYLKGEGTFAATCRVRSTPFEARTRIWRSPSDEAEIYPWRVQIEVDVLAPETGRPRALDLAADLQFTRRWPREHWRLAFQGMLHPLPAVDGHLICQALKQARAMEKSKQAPDATVLKVDPRKGLEGRPG